MDIDMTLVKLSANGVVITNEVKSQVKNTVRQRKTAYHNQVAKLGIPDKINYLFQITKKAQVEQYVRELVLPEYDLFLLIHNCNQIRFTHRSRFKKYIPDHLRVLDKDREEMKTGNARRFRTKVRSGLLERRYIHIHLFEFGNEWHCFYFSHQDIDPADTNHWKYGCHLHYINHLWPNLKKRFVWKQFNKRSTEIPGNVHIRFDPFEFPHPDEAIESNLNDEKTLPPWANIFDSNLASGCGSAPLPVAHVATRGLWITKVSIPYKLN